MQILDDLHQAAAMLVQRLVKALVPSSIHRALFGQSSDGVALRHVHAPLEAAG